MTTIEIQAAVGDVEAMSHSAHSAHAIEDNLYLRFIQYVSTLDTKLGGKARLVLETKKIEFERYYS